MKVLVFIIITLTLYVSAILLVPGCKYDVAEPQYYTTEYKSPDRNPAINSISPSEAVAGANFISIIGENFDLVSDTTIYLETPEVHGIFPEIIEKTSTSIRIRRPNLITDSCTIKVYGQAGVVEKFGPYKIDPVYETYGSFLENHELGAIAADNSGNVYVLERNGDFPLIKILPNGDQIVLVDSLPTSTPLTASSYPTDAKMGPGGFLYLFRSNKVIQKVNTETGEVTRYHDYAPKSKNQLRCGDFDESGYLYTGGARTDLVIIAPDSTSRTSGMYGSTASDADTILAVSVYNNTLYVSVSGTAGRAVYKHSIGAGGTLGTKEPAFDGSTDSRFFSRAVTGVAFTADGKMILSTDSPNPLVVSEGGSSDYFYKDILPPYCKKSAGNNNYLYLIIGNTSTTSAQNWVVYRVDVGSNLIP